MQSTILPADRFIIINKTIFNDNDRKILMRLYQPIIGADSVSLYFNLWSELDKNELMSTDHTHHYLINLLQYRWFCTSKSQTRGSRFNKNILKRREHKYIHLWTIFSP